MTQTRKRLAGGRSAAVRRELHELVNALSPKELHSARRYLQYLRDMSERPRQAFQDAPWDDEPFTPEQQEAVRKGLEDIEAGRVFTLDEVKHELGMT